MPTRSIHQTCLLVCLSLGTSPSLISSYQPSRRYYNKSAQTQRQKFLRGILASVVLATSGSIPESSRAQETPLQFSPPTDEQPQIKFPDALRDEVNTIEGLVSLAQPRSSIRPTGSDILLLTVRDPNTSTIAPLAMARVPVSRINSFPFRFRMTEVNATDQRRFREAARSSDLVVDAVVCPRDVESESSKQACIESSTLQASGVTKLLELQLSVGRKTRIRAPVTLALQARE